MWLLREVVHHWFIITRVLASPMTPSMWNPSCNFLLYYTNNFISLV
jgi:hypothetical protein